MQKAPWKKAEDSYCRNWKGCVAVEQNMRVKGDVVEINKGQTGKDHLGLTGDLTLAEE